MLFVHLMFYRYVIQFAFTLMPYVLEWMFIYWSNKTFNAFQLMQWRRERGSRGVKCPPHSLKNFLTPVKNPPDPLVAHPPPFIRGNHCPQPLTYQTSRFIAKTNATTSLIFVFVNFCFLFFFCFFCFFCFVFLLVSAFRLNEGRRRWHSVF